MWKLEGPKGARANAQFTVKVRKRRGTTRKLVLARSAFRLSTSTGRARVVVRVSRRTLRRIRARKLRVTVVGPRRRAAAHRQLRAQPAEAAAQALAAPELEPDLGGAGLVLGAPAVGQSLDEEEPPSGAVGARRAGVGGIEARAPRR